LLAIKDITIRTKQVGKKPVSNAAGTDRRSAAPHVGKTKSGVHEDGPTPRHCVSQRGWVDGGCSDQIKGENGGFQNWKRSMGVTRGTDLPDQSSDGGSTSAG